MTPLRVDDDAARHDTGTPASWAICHPCAARSCAQRVIARGFTLLELLVVITIIAIGSAGVSFAMRDSAETQVEREAQRLTALLEAARLQSRAVGVPVRWVATEAGFAFVGLQNDSLPTRWLSPGTQVVGTTTLTLGPEPIIGPQSLLLSAGNPPHTLRIATDGLRPFSVVTPAP
ncbi:MAG: Tfp pilus assembly protein FimT/FimU [Burkholderiaceae bacterium]